MVDADSEPQSTKADQVGRYVITNIMYPNAAGEKPFTVRLDTATGRVDWLGVSPNLKTGTNGYADSSLGPIELEDGSMAGWVFWTQMAESVGEADYNEYAPGVKSPYGQYSND